MNETDLIVEENPAKENRNRFRRNLGFVFLIGFLLLALIFLFVEPRVLEGIAVLLGFFIFITLGLGLLLIIWVLWYMVDCMERAWEFIELSLRNKSDEAKE